MDAARSDALRARCRRAASSPACSSRACSTASSARPFSRIDPVRRTPLIAFLVALLLVLATFNELNLSHYGTSIVLAAIAIGAGFVGFWSLRDG